MTTQDKEAVESFEAMKKTWLDYPSQDNEGHRPDRGGFKCGWFEGIQWYKRWLERRIKAAMRDKDQLHHVKLKEDKEAVEAEERDAHEFAHKFLALDPVKGLVADNEGVVEGRSMALTPRTVGYLKMFAVFWLKQREKPVNGELQEDGK